MGNISGNEDTAFQEWIATIQRNTMRETIDEDWWNFVENIKYGNRYFPTLPSTFKDYLNELIIWKEDLGWHETLYRARIINYSNYQQIRIASAGINSGLLGLPAAQMGAPPQGSATSGRANPEGISYLYLASDPETACAEVRPGLLELISVSRFRLDSDINVINLHATEIEDDEASIFASHLISSFSMPTRDKNDYHYSVSQYFAAYFQSQGLDGIKFRSSHNSKSTSYNLILFDPQKAKCMDKYGSIYHQIKSQSSFQNITENNRPVYQVESGVKPVISKLVEWLRIGIKGQKKEEK